MQYTVAAEHNHDDVVTFFHNDEHKLDHKHRNLPLWVDRMTGQ